MNRILHGGDYNPEQWLKYPGVIDEDFRLFKLAHINSISIGIFSWAELEPEEGKFEFSWMDDIFDRAEKQGMSVILATPSGARPNWLALRYPEVMRVHKDGRREPLGSRHNHCYTTPVYREKVKVIDSKLSERYGKRSSLVLWHISNEFNGECHCDQCMEAFRRWLKGRFKGDIEALNDAYWSRFWSHTYRSWEEITKIDDSVNGLRLDWRRFCSNQCREFIRNEVEAIRQFSLAPVTTNSMGMPLTVEYDLFDLHQELDYASWDSYPRWHATSPDFDETFTASTTAFLHDYYRSVKKRPFLLMETTPSQVNWTEVSPLRRPGVHKLNGLQAVAHGADSVCYFQLRKSRGSSEQFHGAVIDHVGHENTRAFGDVKELGAALEKLSVLAGGKVESKVALIFDFDNYWAIQHAQCHQNAHKLYYETVYAHYKPLWSRGVSVDILDSKSNLDGYDLVVAPMLTLLQDRQGERLTEFVKSGGTLVTTYQTGIVDRNGLVFRNGIPGPLSEVLGIWVEEFDGLPDTMRRKVRAVQGNKLGLSGEYEARHFFDLLHAKGAEVLATYGDDFYAGRPAVTVNRFGKGRAYFIASRNDDRFIEDFTEFLVTDLALPRAISSKLPYGVTAHRRISENGALVFLFNFTKETKSLQLGGGKFVDVETGRNVSVDMELAPFGSRILKKIE